MFRLGLIGYGGFGRFLHHAWQQMTDVALVAIADLALPKLPAGIQGYTDWQALLTHADVEGVAIAAPPHLHAAIACAAMEAGKHVLIEKPPALTLEEVRWLQETQARTGRVAMVDFVLRYTPLVALVHTWCREGTFGRLRRVVVENYAQDATLPPTHWFWDPSQSGGILVEHGIHFIDLVQGCTSAALVKVQGAGVWRTPRQMDRMLATVVYADGLVATHYHAFAGPGFFEHTSLRFVFDLARLELTGWIPRNGHLVALATESVAQQLQTLPFFRTLRQLPVEAVPDESRPEGWGLTSTSTDPHVCRFGEHAYSVDLLLEGTFALSASKAEIYQEALRAVLQDFVQAIRHPDHQPRVMLREGLVSLQVALEASRQAGLPVGYNGA
uniref:Gfo/Idh/MocA family oxidoreductase n=1 Tax=Rhodothermus marinus TaxID=29549 RepID=A0A7V2B031_RHOMR